MKSFLSITLFSILILSACSFNTDTTTSSTPQTGITHQTTVNQSGSTADLCGEDVLCKACQKSDRELELYSEDAHFAGFKKIQNIVYFFRNVDDFPSGHTKINPIYHGKGVIYEFHQYDCAAKEEKTIVGTEIMQTVLNTLPNVLKDPKEHFNSLTFYYPWMSTWDDAPIFNFSQKHVYFRYAIWWEMGGNLSLYDVDIDLVSQNISVRGPIEDWWIGTSINKTVWYSKKW